MLLAKMKLLGFPAGQFGWKRGYKSIPHTVKQETVEVDKDGAGGDVFVEK
jgi:hypothetical protein